MRSLVLCALLALSGCEIPLDQCAKNHTCQTNDGGGSGSSTACQISTSTACMDATSHSDLTWIQQNVFDKQCIFSGCHNGAATSAGKVDLRDGMSYAHLVNFASILTPGRTLVVASDPKSSYIAIMLGIIKPSDATPPGSPPPASVGLMPQSNGGQLLCCQKLDAIDRWITAGAMNN